MRQCPFLLAITLKNVAAAEDWYFKVISLCLAGKEEYSHAE